MRFLTFVALTLIPMVCPAQEWRDFKGQFTFVGDIPKRKEIVVDNDRGHLPKDHRFYDESLLVNEKNRGIANILIWVIPDPDKPDAKMPIHPSYTMAPPAEHVIKVQKLILSPHVSIMRTDAKKLLIINEDPIGHNIDISSPEIPASCRSPAPNGRDTWDIKKQTKLPAQVSCFIHPHEKAYLLVRDNPYFAVTNDQGVFEMKNLPVGEWRFKAWHEKSGYITEVTLGKLKHNWPKGEFKIKIDKFDAFLGAIEVPDRLFNK